MAHKKIGARVGVETGNVVRLTREYFDSIAIETRVIDAVEASTEMKLFGKTFKTPAMPAALSGLNGICDGAMTKIAVGTKEAGSLMWAGIGDEAELRAIRESGAETVKVVKPYKDAGLIREKIRQVEEAGALAVGMDINFGFGGKVKESSEPVFTRCCAIM